MLINNVGGGVFDGSLSMIKDGILEVKATPCDDHLHEEDFDNGPVDVGAQELKRKEPTVGSAGNHRAICLQNGSESSSEGDGKVWFDTLVSSQARHIRT